MKVLLLNGSPHKEGCTYTALSEVARVLEHEGIQTEIIQLGLEDIRGCISCQKCKQTGRCVFDDAVNRVAPLFQAADGLVVGSPVYYASPNGTLLSFLDRLFYSTPFSKRMKVGAAIASARRAGTIASLDALNKYFAISEMPIATSRYWNEVHGAQATDTLQDQEGMQTMRVLARNMAFLIKAIAAEKERHGLPETEELVWTNFIDNRR